MTQAVDRIATHWEEEHFGWCWRCCLACKQVAERLLLPAHNEKPRLKNSALPESPPLLPEGLPCCLIGRPCCLKARALFVRPACLKARALCESLRLPSERNPPLSESPLAV